MTLTLKEAYQIARGAAEYEGPLTECLDLGYGYAFSFGNDMIIGGWLNTVDKKTGKLGKLAVNPDNIAVINAGKEVDISTLF